jgi:uncharacterized membrane protein YfcA
MLVIPFALVVCGVFILGVISGGLSNVTSGGAGVFTIYILTNYAGLAIQRSTGTVLAASTLIVLVGAITFYRKRQVHMPLALTVGLSGVVSAFLVARWATTIAGSSIEEAFGGFTFALSFYTAYQFYREWKRKDNARAFEKSGYVLDTTFPQRSGVSERINVKNPNFGIPRVSSDGHFFIGSSPLALVLQIATGVFVGIATGLFGVGLASLSIVLFLLLFKLDTSMALGTSLLASFFRYAGGSIGYLTASQIDPFMFSVLVVGGGLGSILGARIVLGKSKGSKDIYVKLLIVGLLLFISYEFLFKHVIFGT